MLISDTKKISAGYVKHSYTALYTSQRYSVTAHSVLFRSFYTHYQYKAHRTHPVLLLRVLHTSSLQTRLHSLSSKDHVYHQTLRTASTTSLHTPHQTYHGVNPTDTHITDYERNAHLINIEPVLHRRHQAQDVTTPNHPMERRPHQDNELLHLTHK